MTLQKRNNIGLYEMGFKKWDGDAWTGFIWLRIGRGGGRLGMR
jgi:hypothetical protein